MHLSVDIAARGGASHTERTGAMCHRHTSIGHARHALAAKLLDVCISRAVANHCKLPRNRQPCHGRVCGIVVTTWASRKKKIIKRMVSSQQKKQLGRSRVVKNCD